jgi:serine/threonine-protein kinase
MSTANLIGATLGGYAVQALIGSGGMASVYRGLDTQLQRPVAIKVLAPQTAATPGFTDRFRQEARLIANLRHPNIVQVYAFGEEHGLMYMVQELLPGPTLEQHLTAAVYAGQPLAATEIVQIISQLAAALDEAHAAGIIHRDVKPANALWNASGSLVLTDFGIAKALVGATTKTQVGLVMGTPAYMAPEQGQGFELTPASDVYSLGVILYELLAGKVPFVAPTPLAVVLQHIQDAPPPIRVLRPDLPPAVEVVVLQALAKDPQQRFVSAGALATALQKAWSQPVASIYNMPTHVMAAPVAPSRPAATPPTAPSGSPFARPAAPQAASPAPVVSQRRPLSMLPILGGLLTMLMIGGMFLALRGDPEPEAAAPTRPTAQPVATPAASATNPPPNPGEPMAQIRDALAASVADGSSGPNGPTFLATLDQAQQALDQGDTAQATARLSELQRTLLLDARAGTVPPELLRQLLSGIDALAERHTLTLPLSVGTN